MIKFRSGELRLVKSGRTEVHAGKIEPREIETGKLLAGKIGGCRGTQRCLYVGTGHFGRDHIGRRQVEVAHHVLCRCRNHGNGEDEHGGADGALHRQLHGRRS
jgi:hypothetical protein